VLEKIMKAERFLLGFFFFPPEFPLVLGERTVESSDIGEKATVLEDLLTKRQRELKIS
jgi:hypothetical protein